MHECLIGFTPHGGGHVDTALAALGKKRGIGMRMPYVVLSPMIVAESDLVLTTARWLVDKLARSVGLVVKPPPAELQLAPIAGNDASLWLAGRATSSSQKGQANEKMRKMRALGAV
jgi:hypothetical protein